MRVLHIGKFFPPHAGGIEHFSADLCAALAARGVDVAMLAHASPGEHRSRRFRTGNTDVTLAACHGQWLYAPVSPGLPLLLARLIRAFQPDILHLHLPNPSALCALLSPAARRLPWIVHWHADIPLDVARPGVRAMYRLYRPFEQALLRRAHAIIATSAAYRDASVALTPWRAKTRIIPLGLAPRSIPITSAVPQEKVDNAQNDTNTENLAAVDWPGAGLRILAVGRLSYYKGFDVLLRALAQVPEASLLLIGAGECAGLLRALARELGIAARVRFAGQVDDAALARAYAQAQVFCLPSIERTEAFGLVLLEAMRARLAVVASAIEGSGVGHVVVAEHTGLLVPPGDAMALAQALQRIADDADLRGRLGAAGEARWQQEFTLARCADAVLDLYRSVQPNA
jgi:glycosyltransferase involved in cell wall biosynthesis